MQHSPDLFFDDIANIVVQHHFRHFSDDFNGWRTDCDLIGKIKTAALHTEIPDHGYQQITESRQIATWDFVVLDEADGDASFRIRKEQYVSPNKK